VITYIAAGGIVAAVVFLVYDVLSNRSGGSVTAPEPSPVPDAGDGLSRVEVFESLDRLREYFVEHGYEDGVRGIEAAAYSLFASGDREPREGVEVAE